MFGAASLFSALFLVPALVVAARGDWLRRDIPNLLNATIAAMAPLYWWAAGYALWPDIAIILGLALLLLVIFAGAFAIGAMGGGDVKMIAALALWMAPVQLPQFLIVMAIAGGVLTFAMLAHHRLTDRPGKPEIPYGIAIAIGGLWVVVNRILTNLPQTP